MTVPEPTRPPLGVMPKHLWLEQRMQDLSRAIYEYINAGRYFDSCVAEWMAELTEDLDCWQKAIRNNGTISKKDG